MVAATIRTMLHEFIAHHRDEILRRCSEKAADQTPIRELDLKDDVFAPFIDELVSALRRDARLPSAPPGHTDVAPRYGRTQANRGGDVADIVHHFGAMCDAISGLASERRVTVSPREWQVINQTLDDAIARAIREYMDLTTRRDRKSLAEHIGGAAHELRNSLAAASLCYRAIKDGKVPVAGRSGQVLERSLRRASELVGDMLSEAKLNSGSPPSLTRIRVDELVNELITPALLEGRRIVIDVPRVEAEVDARLFASALGNVISNALKYTKPDGIIEVRGRNDERRLTIEVEDECGGLSADPNKLVQPFVQASRDRTGLGLGLTIVRRAVAAHLGELRIRNLPGKGCVFGITIPVRAVQ